MEANSIAPLFDDPETPEDRTAEELEQRRREWERPPVIIAFEDLDEHHGLKLCGCPIGEECEH
jgi:hypothetical protein